MSNLHAPLDISTHPSITPCGLLPDYWDVPGPPYKIFGKYKCPDETPGRYISISRSSGDLFLYTVQVFGRYSIFFLLLECGSGELVTIFG